MAKWKASGLHCPTTVFIFMWLCAGWTDAQPQVSVFSSQAEVIEGQDVTFKCDVREAQGHTVNWLNSASQLEAHMRVELNVINPSIQTATLYITGVKRGDAGQLTCVVVDVDSREVVVRADVTLSVLFLEKKFVTPPQSDQLAVGSTATFLCVPPPGNPSPKVTWRKDRVSLDSKLLGSKYQVTADNTLTITDVQSSDSAWYTCVARNKVGHRRSTVRLTVYDVPKFISLPDNQKVVVGANFTLDCKSAAMVMTLHWKKVGGDLPEKRFDLVDGGNLHIWDAQPSDAGEYVCTVTSPAGKIDASATVEVSPVQLTSDDLEGSGSMADAIEVGAKIKRPLPPLDEGSGEDQLLSPTASVPEEGSGESP